MNSREIRQKYLDFFREKEHAIIPSASLLPSEADPTVLFTTAGMQPLVPFFMGEKHPKGDKLANVQKCVRTDDIEEVGDYTHHTFFEMLGNWSLGDYFKKESLKWSLEFLTSEKWMGLDKNLLAVSVFEGDDDAPFDEEAFDIWRKLGIPKEKIAKLGKKENWWGPAGQTGPCGPDSEIFYWTGDPTEVPESFNDDHPLWVEIWNNVFMQYNKNADGKYEPLVQKNIDTGMGLERMTAVMNGEKDDYKTDLFENIITKIEDLSGQKYDDSKETAKAIRVIADHVRAAVFIMADDMGIAPSNTDQGYIVRRLIRRAIRFGKQLGIVRNEWITEIAQVILNDYAIIYPELDRNKDFIFKNLKEEEQKFSKTLEKGLNLLKKITEKAEEAKETIYVGPLDKNKRILVEKIDDKFIFSGKEAFNLYQTYGFPVEMISEELKKTNLDISVDVKGFKKEFEKHQELSRTAAAGIFKGGLADSGEETAKLHTATHLLLQALKEVLGEHVVQRGSNITAERIRFDFSHPEKMTEEQKQKVENIVNEKIKENLPVKCEEMPYEKAKELGVVGVFEDKYGEDVKVYTIGKESQVPFSQELCGGPHVSSTGDLGHFKIKKEQSSSAGVRRIKATLE